MALLDKIKEQMQSPVQQPANLGGQTDTVRGLLQAKTGKAAVPSSAPRQSSIKEKMAEQQTQLAGQDLQQQGQIQAAQIGEREADIEQRTLQQEQQFQDNLKNLQSDFNRRSNSMLQQFESGQKRLDNQKDMQDLELLGFEARMQNNQYIDQLKQEGDKLRLDQGSAFKEQLARSVFSDNVQLLQDQLAFKTIVDADDRQFQKEMSDMDIDYAMEMADNAMKSTSARQVTQGVGGLVTAGTQAAVSSGAFNKSKEGAPIQGTPNTTANAQQGASLSGPMPSGSSKIGLG